MLRVVATKLCSKTKVKKYDEKARGEKKVNHGFHLFQANRGEMLVGSNLLVASLSALTALVAVSSSHPRQTSYFSRMNTTRHVTSTHNGTEGGPPHENISRGFETKMQRIKRNRVIPCLVLHVGHSRYKLLRDFVMQSGAALYEAHPEKAGRGSAGTRSCLGNLQTFFPVIIREDLLSRNRLVTTFIRDLGWLGLLTREITVTLKYILPRAVLQNARRGRDERKRSSWINVRRIHSRRQIPL